jgi:uncharacterized protein involved in outer membrane biogenesis
MNRWLRRGLIALGALVVLVVGAAVLVPMLVPVDAYKSRIEAAVRERTGRSFEIRGPMSFSVLPSLAFHAEQAVLGNAQGASSPQMVAIKRLDVSVALLPLISSRIEVTRLVLTEPDIALEIARDGRPNWVMGAAPPAPAAAPAAPPQRQAQPAQQPAAPQAPRDPLAGIPDVGLGDVRIVNGHFTYRDQRTNAQQEFTGVNLRLDAQGLDQPVSAQGDLTWNNERMTLELRTPPPRSLLGGTPGQVQVKVQSAPINLDLNAAVDVGRPERSSGTITLAVASPQRLARWIGPLFPLDPAPLADVGATNLRLTLNASGELAAAGDVQVRNEKLELALEGVSLAAVLANRPTPVRLRASAGAAAVLRLEGNVQPAARPTFTGTVDLTVPSVRRLAAWAGHPLADSVAPGQLNALSFQGRVVAEPAKLTITDARFALDQLRGSGTLEATTSGARPKLAGRLAFDRLDLNPYMGGARPAGGGSGAAPTAPAAPAANQPATRAGWDDTPIDATALRTVDLDLNLVLAGLVAQTLELGRTAMRVQLNDGQLDTQISEMGLYGGQARGTMRVDARQALGVQSQMEVNGVQALPLRRTLAGMEKLEGTIAASWTLRASGRSQRALIQDIDGQARMRVTNGSLVGVNLAAMVRSAGTLGLDSGARQAQRTDFSDLSASFAIDNGVATTQDMSMASPLLRVQGRGTVNLPQRTVDMRLDTRLVATLQGQGGREARGVTIPVAVTGPFDNLSYRPDFTGVSQQELQELTRNPGELLRNPGEALRGLLPGGQQQQQQPAQPGQPDQPQQPQQQRQQPNLPFRIPGLTR